MQDMGAHSLPGPVRSHELHELVLVEWASVVLLEQCDIRMMLEERNNVSTSAVGQ